MGSSPKLRTASHVHAPRSSARRPSSRHREEERSDAVQRIGRDLRRLTTARAADTGGHRRRGHPAVTSWSGSPTCVVTLHDLHGRAGESMRTTTPATSRTAEEWVVGAVHTNSIGACGRCSIAPSSSFHQLAQTVSDLQQPQQRAIFLDALRRMRTDRTLVVGRSVPRSGKPIPSPTASTSTQGLEDALPPLC